MRKWCIHIWITLPSKVPMKNGRFPKKLETIDIFPEAELCRTPNKAKIFLRKNRHLQRKDSNYMLQSMVDANDSKEAFDAISEKIELILDMLSFQLQEPIPVSNVEVIDYSKPLRLGDERESMFANSLPRVQKDSRFQYMANWKISLSLKLFRQKFDVDTEAALRWFSKGIAPVPSVDQFACLWIALEILTLPTKPREKVFFKCRNCGHEIKACPKCKYYTSHFPETKERIESFIRQTLGRNKALFENLWMARMFFHGKNKLTSEEIDILSTYTWELRLVVIEALRRKLGLKKNQGPLLINHLITIGPLFLSGRRRLTELDIEYAHALY